MAVEKTFFHWFDCPVTNKRRTVLIQRFVTGDLIPKFEMVVFDGEYKTRTQFENAFDEYRANLENGIPVEEKNFDYVAFYGADFRELIGKCESLEKE